MSRIGHSTEGRGLALGLVLCSSALLACGVDSRPVAVANASYAEPSISGEGSRRLVENHAARELLAVYAELPQREVRPLFLADAAVGVLPGGRFAWPDGERGRVVIFDRFGAVTDILHGAAPDGRRLTAPVSVAADERGVLAVEPDGSALLFREKRPEAWLEPASPGLLGGSSPAGSVVVRTFLEFHLAPVLADDPLLWLVSPNGGAVRPIGRVEVPANGILGQLANTGWGAVAPDGTIYFASALEPELRQFTPEGALEWVSRWTPSADSPEPRLRVEHGSIRPVFTVVQHGLTIGPDGRVYVLASPLPGADVRRLLAFDGGGRLVRSATVPPGAGIFSDTDGRIFSIPLAAALASAPPAGRPGFDPFELPSLSGAGTVDLERYRGRVVVVNFWASWCAPCRQEMPVLDAYAAELAPDETVVLGLNEDVRRSDGLEFLDRIGGVSYVNAAGEGRLRDRYGYRGLPYTVVLDRELRVVKVFYGFGRSIDPIRDAVAAELTAASAGVERGRLGSEVVGRPTGRGTRGRKPSGEAAASH